MILDVMHGMGAFAIFLHGVLLLFEREYNRAAPTGIPPKGEGFIPVFETLKNL